ncbi:hypothetical protein RvY_10746 [Ramazzottius varieornatus]|uniref:Uncharacterized protein n=1 Tax=Ramazzottius varieornatus TaxID=947166 RepID=A0A1D1VDT0_RAMVA|nr:hypothetical protein RvY_10746 [Ramazzottius varieornatus]
MESGANLMAERQLVKISSGPNEYRNSPRSSSGELSTSFENQLLPAGPKKSWNRSAANSVTSQIDSMPRNQVPFSFERLDSRDRSRRWSHNHTTPVRRFLIILQASI